MNDPTCPFPCAAVQHLPTARLARRAALAAWPLASLLMAGAAEAQTPACDQLKARLAARVDPSIRGFTLEAVAGDAPVPPGAKVFGNCEGGAYKILFRRGGDTRPAPAEAVAPAAAPAPAPAPKPAPPPPAPAPVAAPVAPPAPVPVPPPAPAPAPVPVPAPTPPAAAPAAPVVVAQAETPPPAAEEPAPAAAGDSLWQQARDAVSTWWLGLLALGVLPLAAWGWSWLSHRRDYDEAGLPRGPRL